MKSLLAVSFLLVLSSAVHSAPLQVHMFVFSDCAAPVDQRPVANSLHLENGTSDGMAYLWECDEVIGQNPDRHIKVYAHSEVALLRVQVYDILNGVRVDWFDIPSDCIASGASVECDTGSSARWWWDLQGQTLYIRLLSR